MTLDERLRDKLKRHGPDSPNAAAGSERDDYIRAAARRVADRLTAVGQRDPGLERVSEQPRRPQLGPGRRRVGRVLVTLLSDSAAATEKDGAGRWVNRDS